MLRLVGRRIKCLHHAPSQCLQIERPSDDFVNRDISTLHPCPQNALVGRCDDYRYRLKRPVRAQALEERTIFVVRRSHVENDHVGASSRDPLVNVRSTKPKLADKYVIPVSSGVIAGESIIGVVIALLQAKGILS